MSDWILYVQADEGYVHYRCGQGRVGRVETDGEWYTQPGGDVGWVAGYNDVYLVDSAQQKTRTVSRRLDRQWLEYVRKVAVAPDGSIAVRAGPSGWRENRDTVNAYDRHGEPMRQWV